MGKSSCGFIWQTAVEIRGNGELIVMKEVKPGFYFDVAARGWWGLKILTVDGSVYLRKSKVSLERFPSKTGCA